jgi:hypothetical protein
MCIILLSKQKQKGIKLMQQQLVFELVPTTDEQILALDDVLK